MHSLLERVWAKVWNWVVRHWYIRCVLKVFKHWNDKPFLQRVIQMEDEKNKIIHPYWTDASYLYFENLGAKNPGKLIYVFKEVEAIGGFFAQHRRLLLALHYADTYGMTPVVYFGKDYRYHEDVPIGGTTNGFEYYFQPVSEVTYEAALVSQNVIFFAPCHLKTNLDKDFSFYDPSEMELQISAEMQKKYIRLKPEIGDKLMVDIGRLLKGKKTIGIHVRGTDFRLGLKNHPIPIDISEHFKNIRYAFEHLGFEQVFVATDEINTINVVKEEFGDSAVFYSDVFRSSEETAAQYQESDRELHKYNMGVEVLRDMLTLASCDGLTAGLSQVSICANITKRSWGKQYEYYKIISKGLFKDNSEKAKRVINQYIKDGRIPSNIN